MRKGESLGVVWTSTNEALKESGTQETGKRVVGLGRYRLDKISSFSFLATETVRRISKSEGRYIWEAKK